MANVQQLRDQTIQELQAQAAELSREIFELRNELKMTHKLDKPHLLKEKKKQRARALTIITEKQKQE